MNTSKIRKAVHDLERALTFKNQALADSVYYGAIAKAFEVAIEYSWKYFRVNAIEAGLDIETPRDAIKQAGVMGLIEDVEAWLRFLKIRNIAVHDYLGVTPEEYIKEAQSFYQKLKELEKKLPSESGK